ncbi:MAG: polyprenyl synthetase family protein, partial [Conexivisphaerales archaeon]
EYKLVIAANEALEAGKRLRPIITLLICESISGSYAIAIPVAIAYELAHTASLVQDDMIDESEIRHNKLTTYQKYGIVKAILVSDILIFDIFKELSFYSQASISKHTLLMLLKQINKAAHLAIKGQYKEMGSSLNNLDEDEYIQIASMKTGALYAASASSGATLAKADAETVHSMYNFGLNLGIAFQIRDDILDIIASEKTLGKPILNDVKNNSCNIVVVDAISKANPKQKNMIFSFMYREVYTRRDKEEFIELMKQLGSLDYAESLVRKFAERSRRYLSILPNSKARALLEKLTYELESRYR